jgi:hypothetical protein
MTSRGDLKSARRSGLSIAAGMKSKIFSRIILEKKIYI